MADASGEQRGPTPHGAPPASMIPLIRDTTLWLVCGPPGAGKSTWARKHAGPDDLVLDPNETQARLSLPDALAPNTGRHATKISADELGRMREANGKVPKIFLIRCAPRAETRAAWLAALGPRARLHLIVPAHSTVLRRIWADTRHPHRRAERVQAAANWYASYTPG